LLPSAVAPSGVRAGFSVWLEHWLRHVHRISSRCCCGWTDWLWPSPSSRWTTAVLAPCYV